MRVHYPRTPHLPWSPGAGSDDVRAAGTSGLVGREIVVTEKLDGENTTIYRDGLHARSLDSAHHPSRAWVKALHGRIGRSIPPHWRICGENLHARHSIAYDDLESWFYAFSVWDGEHCLDWDRTVAFTRRLGVPVPHVLWRGNYDERVLRALRLDPARQEGYVVRTVEGFRYDEFSQRVAKWVRPGHVQTDEHWMFREVVENGLSPVAALWEVRSGARPDVSSLLTAVALPDGHDAGPLPSAVPEPIALDRAEAAVADVSVRLDLLGRTGDTRLVGVLAALFHGTWRAWLGPQLVSPLGMPLARRVADLVELHTYLHRAIPDEARKPGLRRLALAADVGVMHAVAFAVLAGDEDDTAEHDTAEAREQVAWSELHAEDAGLLGEAPLEPLCAGLRHALRDGDGEMASGGSLVGGPDRDDVADRCWAEAREAYALGRISTAEEAVALTWRWRSGRFPRLVVMVGPSASGKSTFARNLPATRAATRASSCVGSCAGSCAGVCGRECAGDRAGIADDAVVSLDDLRQARGSRSNQRGNADVLREGLRRLDTLLAGGGTAVWDATALNRHQRSLMHAVARRHDALTTHAVMLVPGQVLERRNAKREHQVPPEVLAAQLRRFSPPFPGEAHRTWYIGEEGDIRDIAGALNIGSLAESETAHRRSAHCGED